MTKRMLIDAAHREETRIVVADGTRIDDFDFESEAKKQLKGNIYLARVTRVEPSLQAAFVEYGGNRHGFLAFSEIHPDYYQIPVSDKEKLLAQQAEEEAELARKDLELAEEEAEEALLEDDEEDDDEDWDDDEDDDEEEITASSDDEDDEEDGEEEDVTASAETEDEPSEAEASDDSGEDKPATTANLDAPEAATKASDVVEADEDDETSSEEDSDETEAASDESEEDGEDEAPRRSRRGRRGGRGRRSSRSERGERSGGRRGNSRRNGGGRRRRSNDDEDDESYAQRKLFKNYKIQEVIRRRQVMLIQVVKEERGNKGAALTTYLSLAGRYGVLMPNTARGGGISRKITNLSDRKRLKSIVSELDVPKGMGLIIRTAGANRNKAEIKRDYDYLIRLWETIRDLTLKSSAPSLIYEEGNLIKRSIRDLYTKDVEEVLVEGREAYQEAKGFMRMLMPSHTKKVRLYTERIPLYQRYHVETQLDSMLSPRVELPSGGYLIINQTEALVSVDVNSGRATKEHNVEQTALKTNLEAAAELARQLRLRDLAGLIVIDFIDMEEHRNNRAVERRLKEHLEQDRARLQVGRISSFGLLEMSRQRLRAGILEGSTRPCPHCEGGGIVRSVESAALRILRACGEEGVRERSADVTVRTNRETADYILNHKRRQLLEFEELYGMQTIVVADPELHGDEFEIDRGEALSVARREELLEKQTDSVSLDTAYLIEQEEKKDEVAMVQAALEMEADEEDEAPQAEDTSDDEENPRRRRRGRRGGRRNRRGREETGAESDTETTDADTSEGETEAEETSADNEEDSNEDKPKRSRRRGRRGGRNRRRPSNDRAEGNSEDDAGNSSSSDNSSDDESGKGRGRRRKVEIEETEAPREPAMADAAPAPSPAPSGSDDEQGERKGWWQKRWF